MSGERRGVLFAIGAAFWAAVFLIPYQAAVQRAERGSVLVAMLLSAAVFNSLVAFAQERRRIGAPRRIELSTSALLAVGTILGNTALAVALPHIGPGMTSVVMKAQVLITPVASWWFLRERPPRALWVGAAVALAGFALPYAVQGAADLSVGYLAAFAAAVVFAGMQVLTRRVILRIRPAVVNALRLWVATGTLLVLPVAWGGGRLALDETTWLLAILAGVVGPGLSRLFLMSAVRTITASLTALVALVGPLFAFAFGYLVFGTVPTGWDALGALLILAGVLWPGLRARRSPPRPA